MRIKDLISKIKKNKTKVTLKDFIQPAVLPNCDASGNDYGKKEFDTTDKVYLFSSEELKDLTDLQRMTFPTDYAIVNGVSTGNTHSITRQSCFVLTRSNYIDTSDKKLIITQSGSVADSSVTNSLYTKYGIAPCLHLDCKKVIQAQKELGMFNITVQTFSDNSQNHCLQFGFFPQTYVGDELNDKLTFLLNNDLLKSTGKKYLRGKEVSKFLYRDEYVYKGKKYVFEIIDSDAINNILKNGKEVLHNKNDVMWFSVEPIEWKILNWNDLPREINPNGTGKTNYIEIASTEALLTKIPITLSPSDNNSLMWQNSIVRQALNGYDIREEMKNKNGNPNFQAKQNIPCVNQGFVDQAFTEKVDIDFDKKIVIEDEQNNSFNTTKTLSSAEIARNELIKKALERKKQQSNNNDDQNENIL